ncbi:tetratricopeptide (TPR) repeat protein [Azospirillum lipoferum]|uniref:Tetratricopeptide repeat protein n=1 Tax=Azospirillum lipoferum TaxID=193 RepID=A0A5A9GMY4_AZOLI|nr:MULTISPECIES: tetratricopeptide repeat protein [Azospirillum]KAA0595175.1 tetratricopeptide repeat protein [Azospirillum lipoferum]MCP1611954.1 tetratricopeptide (TPR) repeat protein [Azospirillum lipoferum]MDW5533287.1 tetratricopeptide repeat protein [Azospirillum sp. NL1]
MDFGLLSLPVLALSALLGYAVVFDTSTVMFHDIGVPNSIESQGYTPKVMAARLANEVRSIDQKARTVKDIRDFSLPDDDSAVNALSDYFKFAEPIRATQEMLGLVRFTFNGDMVARGDDLHLSVRGYGYNGHKPFNQSISGKDPNQILHEMAIDIVRFIDPYVVASYMYETTHDANSKDFASAIREVRYCMVHLPKGDLHWAYNLHGLILTQQGKQQQAIERFNEALKLKPDFLLPVYNTGNALLEMKQYDQAIAKFKEVLNRDAKGNTRMPHAYTQWGVALMRQGRLDEAAQMMQKAMAIDPMYADAYYQFGQLLRQQGKTEEGREMIQRAIDRAPQRTLYSAELTQALTN